MLTVIYILILCMMYMADIMSQLCTHWRALGYKYSRGGVGGGWVSQAYLN